MYYSTKGRATAAEYYERNKEEIKQKHLNRYYRRKEMLNPHPSSVRVGALSIDALMGGYNSIINADISGNSSYASANSA